MQFFYIFDEVFAISFSQKQSAILDNFYRRLLTFKIPLQEKLKIISPAFFFYFSKA